MVDVARLTVLGRLLAVARTMAHMEGGTADLAVDEPRAAKKRKSDRNVR